MCVDWRSLVFLTVTELAFRETYQLEQRVKSVLVEGSAVHGASLPREIWTKLRMPTTSVETLIWSVNACGR